MQVPGLCASIYSVFYFEWRGTGLEQKGPVTSEWIWVVTGKKTTKRIELITMLCFFNAPVSHSSCLAQPPPPPNPSFHHFPLGSDKEELALVPPFLHAFQGYTSASFSPPVSVWRSASLHPSLFVPPKSFCPHSFFPSPFICPYPSPGKLTSKCE